MNLKKERPKDGYAWEVSPNRLFFVFDPEGDGLAYYATESERDNAASEAIKGYLSDGWSEEVTNVIAGRLTHTTKKCDVISRPDEIDENDCDGEGNYWGEFDHFCNYKLTPLELKTEGGT